MRADWKTHESLRPEADNYWNRRPRFRHRRQDDAGPGRSRRPGGQRTSQDCRVQAISTSSFSWEPPRRRRWWWWRCLWQQYCWGVEVHCYHHGPTSLRTFSVRLVCVLLGHPRLQTAHETFHYRVDCASCVITRVRGIGIVTSATAGFRHVQHVRSNRMNTDSFF